MFRRSYLLSVIAHILAISAALAPIVRPSSAAADPPPPVPTPLTLEANEAGRAYADMMFVNRDVTVEPIPGRTFSARLNGMLAVAPDGVVNGVVDVTFTDGSSVMLMVVNDDTTASTAYGSSLRMTVDYLINEDGLDDFYLVSSTPVPEPDLVPLDVVIDVFQQGLRNAPTVSAMHPLGRIMTGVLMVQSTPEYQANSERNRLTGEAIKKFWCKLAIGVAAGILAALVFVSCLPLITACAGGTKITFGALLVLCAPIIARCLAGGLGTFVAVYNILKAQWKP